MKSIFLLFFLFSSSFLHAANAVEIEGHRYPLTLEAEGVTWTLRGTEHFRYKVFFSVFTAALYHQTPGKGERLRFTYTRNLKAADLREQAIKTLTANNDAATLEKFAALTGQIQAAYVDVKKGDSYTITMISDRGTWLHLNGKELFFSENAEFGDWYLDIWLGNPPISPSLKAALMKENDA